MLLYCGGAHGSNFLYIYIVRESNKLLLHSSCKLSVKVITGLKGCFTILKLFSYKSSSFVLLLVKICSNSISKLRSQGVRLQDGAMLTYMCIFLHLWMWCTHSVFVPRTFIDYEHAFVIKHSPVLQLQSMKLFFSGVFSLSPTN